MTASLLKNRPTHENRNPERKYEQKCFLKESSVRDAISHFKVTIKIAEIMAMAQILNLSFVNWNIRNWKPLNVRPKNYS